MISDIRKFPHYAFYPPFHTIFPQFPFRIPQFRIGYDLRGHCYTLSVFSLLLLPGTGTWQSFQGFLANLYVTESIWCIFVDFRGTFQTCQVSRTSRETHTFSMSITLSLRTVEISRIFLLNEKQYFNVTSVLLLWWEMRVLTPVLLLLTLGLLIFMCGSNRHTAQCPGSKLVHSKWLCKCRLVLGSTSTQFTVCGTVSI